MTPDYLNDQQLESELVIGFVSAVGTETSLVIALLKDKPFDPDQGKKHAKYLPFWG